VNKAKTVWVCSSCGHRSPKSGGFCPSCRAYNTLQEEAASPTFGRTAQAVPGSQARRMGDISLVDAARITTGIADFDGSWKPYRAVGCSNCTNGYRGRVGLYQVMPITEEIQRIILAEGTAMDIAVQAQKDGVHAANFASSVVKWAIWIFTLMVVFTQLGIAQSFIQTLFVGVVAMLALAGGLAFGLGGRDHASRVLDGVSKMVKRD
jgi:hypothetical protein